MKFIGYLLRTITEGRVERYNIMRIRGMPGQVLLLDWVMTGGYSRLKPERVYSWPLIISYLRADPLPHSLLFPFSLMMN